MVKIIPLLFLGLGLLALFQVSSPIVGYKIWETQLTNATSKLTSPQIDEDVLGISIEQDIENFPAFVSGFKRSSKPPFDKFVLSLPKLKIEEALVNVDSNDLKIGLAHLPGAALPGERGNVFISGHSALPQFFNGNKNYGSIFANLTKLERGDEINLKVLGTEFVYKVVDIKIVSPKDISVVNPSDNEGRFVTLMTCVPPGLNTKRLVVIGKLI